MKKFREIAEAIFSIVGVLSLIVIIITILCFIGAEPYYQNEYGEWEETPPFGWRFFIPAAISCVVLFIHQVYFAWTTRRL